MVAERDNMVINIAEEEIETYLAQGYTIKENGKVVKECIPSDVDTLQKLYKENMAKIAELEATIEGLQKPARVKKSK